MSLFRNALTVGGATLASRVLGFVRDTLIAAVLGTGPVADAFFVAFRLPNLFRRLFAEGAFATAFVPLQMRIRAEQGDAVARRFSGEALAMLLAVVGTLTVAAIVFAPPLVDLLAPGYGGDPAKRALAITLTRITFPYLACISTVALLSGLLATERRFLVPSLAPVALNLVLIAALAALVHTQAAPATAGTVLAIAVTVAGTVQVVMLLVAVARLGLAPPLVAPRVTPEIRRLIRLGLPGLAAGAMSEINIVIGTVIASGSAGAVSWLYYADRLYQLPLGVVGIAIGQVLLPEIALRLRGGADEAFAVQNRALEFALALALPAALALLLLADPIIAVLFERGAFATTDRLATARALAILAAGLPAFVLVKVLAPGFFGREDTRTPMLIGAVAVAANVTLSLALWPPYGWLAVAIATAAAGWINAALLWALLRARGHWRVDAALRRRLPRLALAAAAMALVVAALAGPLAPALDPTRPLWVKGGALALLVATGLAVYVTLVLVLDVVDRRGFRRPSEPELRPSTDPCAADRDVAATCPRPADRA